MCCHASGDRIDATLTSTAPTFQLSELTHTTFIDWHTPASKSLTMAADLSTLEQRFEGISVQDENWDAPTAQQHKSKVCIESTRTQDGSTD